MTLNLHSHPLRAIAHGTQFVNRRTLVKFQVIAGGLRFVVLASTTNPGQTVHVDLEDLNSERWGRV